MTPFVKVSVGYLSVCNRLTTSLPKLRLVTKLSRHRFYELGLGNWKRYPWHHIAHVCHAKKKVMKNSKALFFRLDLVEITGKIQKHQVLQPKKKTKP